MKIKSTFTIASALLLAAGCASHERQARYQENIYTSPAYSSTGVSTDNNVSTTQNTYNRYGSTIGYSGSVAGQTESPLIVEIHRSLEGNTELAPVIPLIHISATDGAVVLTGKVNNEDQKRQIETLVQQTTGVTTVNNQIQISNQSSSSAGSSTQTEGLSSTGSSTGSGTTPGWGSTGNATSGSSSITTGAQSSTGAQPSEMKSGGIDAEGQMTSAIGSESSQAGINASSSSNAVSGATSEQMTPTSRTDNSSQIYQEGATSSTNENQGSTSDQSALSPTSDRSGQAGGGNGGTASSRAPGSASGSASGSMSAGSSGSAYGPTDSASGAAASGISTQSGTQSGQPSATMSGAVPGGIALNIQGTSDNDRIIVQQVTQELRSDATLAPILSQIRITIVNGQATVNGAVRDEQQKQKIESSVQRATGVTAVDNQLTVGAGSIAR